MYIGVYRDFIGFKVWGLRFYCIGIGVEVQGAGLRFLGRTAFGFRG